MIPFNVEINGKKVGIHWESLIWFFIATAAATVVGELVYTKWVLPYLNDLPNLPNSVPQLPSPSSSIVSVQTPSRFNTGMMNPTNDPNLPH